LPVSFIFDTSFEDIKSMSNTVQPPKNGFLVRCWSGQARLWQAFWLCGVVGYILCGILIGALFTLLVHSPQDRILGYVVVTFPTFLFLIFISVSIWRCAPNVTLAPIGTFARVLVMLSAFALLFSLAR
jgi:hypothetical protein